MTLPLESVLYNLSAEFDNSSLTTEVPRENTYTDDLMERVADILNVYYTPTLVGFGSLGNLISIIVFYKSKLRQQSTSQYLSALALSDTIFLLQLLPPWLKAVEVSNLFTRRVFCQVFVYLSYMMSNNSAWLVVTFTVERFVAVVYPLKRNAICTVKRARHMVVFLAISSALSNLPVLWFAVPHQNDCNIDAMWMDHAARFNLYDTLFSFSVPLIVIVFLNVWIVFGICRLSRTRRELVRQQQQQQQQRPRRARLNAAPAVAHPEDNVEAARPVRGVSWHCSQQRVTRMLLFVSSVFVLLNMPAYAVRVAAYSTNMSGHEYNGRWAALQQICLLFFNTNFGINFYLYCLTGQNFRKALFQTFPWLRGRRRNNNRNALRTARASSVSTSFVHSISNTEAAQCVDVEGETNGRRRRRPERVIQRWRFDNSRQRNAIASTSTDAGAIEMQPLPYVRRRGNF